ncbi:MAG: glycerol-3-phosphate 1-O-acyltransferase PlsY [Fimbriimonadaceae bacterium]
MMNGWILLVLSYFVGSIPVGVMVAKARGIDITKEGSGNVGATNIARVLGKKAGAVCLILDVLKGFVPALVFQVIVSRPIFGFGFPSQEFGLICGGLAMVGHMFSPFLKFKGGKGIATGLGMLVGSSPMVGGWVLLSFIVVAIPSRIVSLSSLVAVAVMVVAGLLLTPPPLFWGVYIALAAFIYYKHWPNIQRIIQGTEPKFSFGGGKKEEPLEKENAVDASDS